MAGSAQLERRLLTAADAISRVSLFVRGQGAFALPSQPHHVFAKRLVYRLMPT